MSSIKNTSSSEYNKRALVLSRRNKAKAAEILGIETAAFMMALRQRYEWMED